MFSKALIRPLAIGVVLVALFAFFFVYPGHDPKPHDLPVVMVGDNPQVAAVLHKQGFEVQEADSLDDAREAILDREAYAALSFDDQRVLVSSAASFIVADAITRQVAALPGGDAFEVEDIRETDAGDPRGLSINLAVLATTVPAILGAMLIVTLAPMVTGRRRLVGLVALAVVGGLASTLIIHQGIEAVPGNFFAVWGVTTLAVFSIAATSAAIIQLLGPAGIGLSFILLLMLGNPASGAASGRFLLPEPWRTGGQFLPPGAFGTGLRNVAYFDGAQAGLWAGVLVAWAAIGSLVVLLERGVKVHAPGVSEPAAG
jgi:hypothetical protein